MLEPVENQYQEPEPLGEKIRLCNPTKLAPIQLGPDYLYISGLGSRSRVFLAPEPLEKKPGAGAGAA